MKNQCDGCMAKMPIVGGIHIDKNGNLFMVCTKRRYIEKEVELADKGL